MKNILIRKANLDDTAAIQNLNHELFKLEKKKYDSTLVTDWPLSVDGKKYFRNLIKNEYVSVATDNGAVVGYLAGSIEDRGAYSLIQYGEINNMFVNEKYRGCGVGTALVKNFKKYCASKKIKNFKVVASAKNKTAIKFYKTMGFGEFDITLTTPTK
jgi:ribosomal protein S18 acetylase RimI-like enzyme